MTTQARLRFRGCVAFAIIFTVLAMATVLWPDWIEGLTGLHPDRGNGSAEEAVTAVFASAAVLAGGTGAAQWRRAKAALGSAGR